MTYYEQILQLKNNEIDDIARGNKFESIIREIQPWDKKPPIVMYPKTEELDGVFTYQNTVFIIESKAKKNTITAGSKDWEDYELKIQRRKGKGVIGLFCSLYEVNSNVVHRANSLNEQGIFNILIYGKNWEQLSLENLDFSNFIDFMILNSKINFVASVGNLNSAKKWHYDKKHINNNLNSMCEKQSSIFLRRFKHTHHDQIYVNRKIEKKLNHQIKLFCPSVLKKSKNESIEQLMLLRDKSGSGKTSLSIEKIITNESAFSFGSTAKQIEIDVFFDNFLNQIQYKNYGLKELEAVDKPYLYIVDSLDEVFKKDQHQKRLEIKSLIKKIEELNDKAANENIRKFPLLVLFTLREEFWRDWEESFDGREVIHLKNMISSFSDRELNKALIKYSNVYNYKIENTLSSESKTILSIPINLEIFSEVNSHSRNIKVKEIWEGEILSEYFQKKHDNILSKHYVEGLNEESFLSILSFIANYVVSNKNLIFDKKKVKKIIEDDFPNLASYFSDILKLLISEQIFILNPDSVNLLRFKYTRFVEYLVSLYIIERINSETKLYLLDKFIQKVFESQVVDIHTILKNIRQICQTKYVEIGEKITEYYQTSDVYLQKHLPRLRREIAFGKETKSDDIQELISKSYSQNPKITWDAFFIVSAKKNKQKKEIIISSFKVAWETNSDFSEKFRRWKLIDKLGERGLLINEKVVNILFEDSLPKDWEMYLGRMLEYSSSKADEFYDFWFQIDGSSTLKTLTSIKPNDWLYVNRLLDIVLNNKDFIKGDLLYEPTEKDKNYIVFARNRFKNINKETKNEIDEYLENLLSLIDNDNLQNRFYSLNSTKLEPEEIDYLNEEFKIKVKVRFPKNRNFFGYLIINYHKYEYLINSMMYNKFIKIKSVNQIVDQNKTLIQLIALSGISAFSGCSILNYIYNRGYSGNSNDDDFFSDISGLKSDIHYLSYFYYKVSDKELCEKIFELDKILFTIMSIKQNCVIGFGFSNLIQVANNALQHYKKFNSVIIKAIHFYDRYEELSEKESFTKKINEQKNTEQDYSFDYIFKSIFPELFPITIPNPKHSQPSSPTN